MVLEAKMPKMTTENVEFSTAQLIPHVGKAFAWGSFEMSRRYPKATWILLLPTDP